MSISPGFSFNVSKIHTFAVVRYGIYYFDHSTLQFENDINVGFNNKNSFSSLGTRLF